MKKVNILKIKTQKIKKRLGCIIALMFVAIISMPVSSISTYAKSNEVIVTDNDTYGDIALKLNSDMEPGEEPKSITLTAIWERDSAYALATVNKSDKGKVEPTGETFVKKGENLKLTITPNEGYEISGIIINSLPLDLKRLVDNKDGTYSLDIIDINEDLTVNIKMEESKDFNQTDTATGINVTAKAGVLPNNSKLVVSTIKKGTKEYEGIYKDLPNLKSDDIVPMYEIHIEDEFGRIIQPNGSAIIKIPKIEKDKLTAIYCTSKGMTKEQDYKEQDDYFELWVGHFSYYSLVYRPEIKPVPPTPTPEPEITPTNNISIQTSDISWKVIASLIGVIILSTTTIYFLTKKKEKHAK